MRRNAGYAPLPLPGKHRHLAVDQDAVPTFVEVKRACDTRARREVVAQMLDYAANGSVFWTPGQLRNWFEGDDPDGATERLVSLLGPSDQESELTAGRAERLLNLVDQWIENIRAHAEDAETTNEI
jgi:hypothetical protein